MVYGMHLVSAGYYQKGKTGFGGKVGHVVFDALGSVTVKNRLELEIANLILRQKAL